MSDQSPAGFSYNTRLNVLHGPLEVIDVAALVDACEDQWYNQTLCRVDESVVRLGVVHGDTTGTSTRAKTSSSTSSAGGLSSIWKSVQWS